MPISVSKTVGRISYMNIFIGPLNHTTHVKLDVSTLTANEVDPQGYVKPGTMLKVDGTLVSGASQAIFGVVPEATKIRMDNANLGADTSDPLIAVATIAQVSRGVVEANLGRALSANELAAIPASGLTLVP